DDNSPDGTGKLADEMSRENPRIHVIHRPGKLGLGTAYVAGFHYGLEHGFDQILTMDGDMSHNPRHIPAMRELAGRCNLVIGSRYVPGGSVRNWPFRRVILSGVANQLARNLLGLHARDCTSGFRLYQAKALARLNLDRIKSNGYSFLVEILFYFQWKDMTVGEVPIVFINRVEGTSKISQDEVFKAVFTLFRLKLFMIGRGGFPSKPSLPPGL
ncbi:MAG: polyprenol monophosphomannose synthase, partial [bacterium]|nr:polyprenol monophosphomannose synthase [bacterium]